MSLSQDRQELCGRGLSSCAEYASSAVFMHLNTLERWTRLFYAMSTGASHRPSLSASLDRSPRLRSAHMQLDFDEHAAFTFFSRFAFAAA